MDGIADNPILDDLILEKDFDLLDWLTEAFVE